VLTTPGWLDLANDAFYLIGSAVVQCIHGTTKVRQKTFSFFVFQSVSRANSRAERVFILEHYFASKSFAAVREAFSNAFLIKEVLNKTPVHRLVTKFRDTGSVCDFMLIR
jgi:hypothetical protein